MTITFENEKDIIVYALEKSICYARDNRYIFLAQSVWWIASVIGLSEGLSTHIDNLRTRTQVYQSVLGAEQISAEPAKPSIAQDKNSFDKFRSLIHPDRVSQVDTIDKGHSEVEISEPESDRATSIIQGTNQFIGQSRKYRQALKRKPCVLSRTRLGKVPVKTLTKKQRNRLQAISKDTISDYLAGRKN